MNNKQNYYKDIFLKLLELGQQHEKDAQRQLIKYYNDKYILVNENDDNKYDFQLSNNKKYEVKADIKGGITGSIYIEFYQFNKPSGINTTQAHFYIIIVPKYNFDDTALYMKIKVKKLNKLINNKKYKSIIGPTNKNNNTGGYLFNLDIIKQQAHII